jgi:hypothetical protein
LKRNHKQSVNAIKLGKFHIKSNDELLRFV